MVTEINIVHDPYHKYIEYRVQNMVQNTDPNVFLPQWGKITLKKSYIVTILLTFYTKKT